MMVRILPDGVTSKKLMGARSKMPINTAYSPPAALRVPRYPTIVPEMVVEATTTPTKCVRASTDKTIKQLKIVEHIRPQSQSF